LGFNGSLHTYVCIGGFHLLSCYFSIKIFATTNLPKDVASFTQYIPAENNPASKSFLRIQWLDRFNRTIILCKKHCGFACAIDDDNFGCAHTWLPELKTINFE